ncbi:MAG: PQQ-binding-like beta-propeller repeat protein [Hyphomonadaceae bacterium]|nr:PQQ-binding-like beta-propeller repeat protein [Hyphomonadaceae bacterium]
MKTSVCALAGTFLAVSLSACSTIGKVADAVNPFDETGSEKRERQGEVGGENQRVSLLSVEDTLSVTGDLTPADVALPVAYVNAEWSQTGGSMSNVMQHTAANGTLQKIWSRDIGDGSGRKGRVTAPPVIAGGRIFAMDADNNVIAIDAGSGSKIWDHKIEVESVGRTREGRTGIFERVTNPFVGDGGGRDKESVGGGLAAVDGIVFATSGLGVIRALDADTGGMIWSRRLNTPMHSAPKVAGGRLFVVSDDNELFAVNAETGEVLWTYRGIVESARMLTTPSPAIVDDVVVAPFASGEIVAFQVQNGNVLWQDSLSAAGRLTPLATLNDISGGPAIADGYVIATAQSGIINAFDLRTGQRIWTQPAGSLGFPWVVGDFVYTVTTNGEVICLSKVTGGVIWIRELRAFKKEKKRKGRISWAGPVLAGDRLVLFSSRGGAVEVSPYDGSILREFDVDGEVYVPPVIANETIYVYNDDAKITAYR